MDFFSHLTFVKSWGFQSCLTMISNSGLLVLCLGSECPFCTYYGHSGYEINWLFSESIYASIIVKSSCNFGIWFSLCGSGLKAFNWFRLELFMVLQSLQMKVDLGLGCGWASNTMLQYVCKILKAVLGFWFFSLSLSICFTLLLGTLLTLVVQE